MRARKSQGSTLRIQIALLALGLAFLGLGGACSSPKPPPALLLPGDWLPSQAMVVEVHGKECLGRNPGQSWRNLKPGDWLAPGSLVEARASSSVVLRLYEIGVLIEIKSDSLLRLETISYRREGRVLLTSTVLDLQRGRVVVDSSNLPRGSEFVIRTPQGTSRIPTSPGK